MKRHHPLSLATGSKLFFFLLLAVFLLTAVPGLQAFRDYAFRGGDFKEERMRTQIKASEEFGSSGWMFWNPRNIYPKEKWTN